MGTSFRQSLSNSLLVFLEVVKFQPRVVLGPL
jgi:hypothetical protein